MKENKEARYSTLIIYYFTGTGNARRASEWMISRAGELGLTTHLISIDRFKSIDVPDFKGKALIGFASPTHGFNLAPIMLKFIHRFPKRINADVFVLNTRAGSKMNKKFMAGLSGCALWYPTLVLRFKRYNSRGVVPIDLPSNWFTLHPALNPEVVESMHVHYKQKSERIITEICSGKYQGKAWGSLPLDLLLLPVSLLFYFLGRFLLAKTYFADHTCTSCGKCARNCPVEAIEMRKGLPFWKINCESCMRCISNCPDRSIQTNHLFQLIVWGVLYYLVYLVTKQTDIALNIDPYGFAGMMLLFAYSIIVTFLAIPLFNLIFSLQHYKSFRKLLSLTSITRLKFWRRYKYDA